MSNKLTEYSVGKPFPGAYPTSEGCVMEMGKDGGLYVLIQFPGLTRPEKQAFKKSFKRYAYFESDTQTPVAMWIFDFHPPFGAINVNFNARLARAAARAYLEAEANLLHFFLLDGPIIQGMKGVGLEWDAVDRFKATIRKQLALEYADSDYGLALSLVMRHQDEDLMRMGTLYKK